MFSSESTKLWDNDEKSFLCRQNHKGHILPITHYLLFTKTQLKVIYFSWEQRINWVTFPRHPHLRQSLWQRAHSSQLSCMHFSVMYLEPWCQYLVIVILVTQSFSYKSTILSYRAQKSSSSKFSWNNRGHCQHGIIYLMTLYVHYINQHFTILLHVSSGEALPTAQQK